MWRLVCLAALTVLLAACEARQPEACGMTAPVASPEATEMPSGAAPAAPPTPHPLERGEAPVPPPTPRPSSTPIPMPFTFPTVTGLFSEPCWRAPDRYRAMGAPPSSPYTPWDGRSTVLYDIEARAETNLGPGSLGRFSPNSRRMAWSAAPQRPGESPEVWLLDLESKARRSLGPGNVVGFVVNNRLEVSRPGSAEWELIDLRSGERQHLQTSETWVPPSKQTNLSDGQILTERDLNVPPYPETSWTYFIFSPFGKGTLRVIDAYLARPTRYGELVIATIPTRRATNIFIVDVVSGQATFVATSRFSRPRWPLAANRDVIVWTEDYCGGYAAGKLRIYDRRTGELIETERSDWVQLTPGGLLAIRPRGSGTRALFDPRTWRYTVTIPGLAPGVRTSSADDVSWSPDYRYASRGFADGHGGLC